MGKKNIDKLFQEKLKGFSEVPDEKVWQSIETSLDQKKKSRKLIPIWWKLGGAAAILLLAVTLLNPFKENTPETLLPKVTDANTRTDKETENNTINQSVENENNAQFIDLNHEAKSIKKEILSHADALVSTSDSSNQTQTTADTKITNRLNLNNENSLAQTKENNTNLKDDVVSINSSESKLENNQAEKNSSVSILPNPSQETLVQNDEKQSLEKIDDSKKKSIFEEINENEAIVENSSSRWSAGPNIAPVYFDALGEGSPVHSIFVPNNKSGEINLSYGLSVAYEVSKKLSIRSGINKVEYGYRTNDVEFSSSLQAGANWQIDNIDYAQTSKNLIVSSKASNNFESLSQNPFLDNSAEFSSTSSILEGNMEQRLGYLEVPLELEYALINKRFGVNLIGGLSSLFLIDNSIALNSGNLTTEVGEANNVNSMNFSTNVGFGLNYKFTSKVQFNIEPVFKYQLNTFSETDGTFNPFSVGVYSGLNFKF